MAGYKRTVLELDPAMFITFDGEPFDAVDRLYTHSPLEVFDESPVMNNGVMIVGTDEPNYAYRAGYMSLVALEPANQHAMGFGTYGQIRGVYPRALVQVPDNPAYNTAPEGGSFTLAFLFNKLSDEQLYRTSTNQPYTNLSRTLVHKQGTITVRIADSWGSQAAMVFELPNGVITIAASNIPNFYGSTHHVVVRFDSSGAPGTGYFARAQIIIDGETKGILETQYTDAPPVSMLPRPFEIGGHTSHHSIGNEYNNDQATSATYIDQVAFWARALEDVHIWRLFRKIWPYREMVKKKRPLLYIPMEDEAWVETTSFETEVGSANINHIGTAVRARPGPPGIPSSKGTLFSQAMLVIKNGQSPPFSLDQNAYAFEFWLKTGGTARSVVMSMQGVEKPFRGPLLEMNVDAGGLFSNGMLTFREGETAAVSTPRGEGFNNANWHHVIIQRRSHLLEIFVNGELKTSQPVAREGSSGFSHPLYFLGTMPGRLYTEAELSHIAVYSGRTFERFEASTRYQYSKIYRIRGKTTLRGVPYRARVRVYKYLSGELITQADTLAQDGSFTFYLEDNSLVCSQILSMNDQNVRVRGFGPIQPAEVDDYPEG